MLRLSRDTIALFRIKHQTVVAFVVSHASIKPQRILIRPFQPATVDDSKRCRIRHMRVQHASGVRLPQMEPSVNKKRGSFDLMLAFDDIPIGVGHDQIGRCNLRPVQSLRIDQKAIGGARNCKTEMIADAFVKSQSRCPSKSCREVDSRLNYSIVILHKRLFSLQIPTTDNQQRTTDYRQPTTGNRTYNPALARFRVSSRSALNSVPGFHSGHFSPCATW